MCFSVNVNLVKEELENRYGATLIDPENYRPSYYYHAFTLPELPAVCSGEPEKISLLKWGLIPHWTKTREDADAIRFRTFNARAESVATRPSFSASFKSRRCIIPVRGFFEWQHVGKEKIPWYIYHSGDDILSVAGLYDEWTESDTGLACSTFTIITTDANDLMAEIHNSARRMPVILDKAAESAWISLTTSPDEAQGLLDPCPSDILKAHTVSPMINDRTRNRNTAEVIEPYSWPSENLLF